MLRTSQTSARSQSHHSYKLSQMCEGKIESCTPPSVHLLLYAEERALNRMAAVFTAPLWALVCIFQRHLYGEAASLQMHTFYVLSFMSMLSWWLRRQAGESTSVFQESFQRTIFRHHFPSLSGFDKAHIKWFLTPRSPLLPTFYSLYLCIMYIHMYTVRKICNASNVA